MRKIYINFCQLIKVIALIFFFLIVTNILQAQPADTPDDPESAPVDGGLTVLIIAGIGYASKKIKAIQEEKEQNEKPE